MPTLEWIGKDKVINHHQQVPYHYLVHVFTEAPKLAARGEDWVTAMLPQNTPDSCKAGKKERGDD